MTASPEPGRGAPAAAYLDATSSEPLHPAARQAMVAALDAGYADPRRLHRPARSARLLLDNAREAAATALGVRPDELTFTPSGTDATHRGLLGLHRGRARAGRTLVHGAVEHSSVLHAARWSGSPLAEVPADRRGRVAPEAVLDAVRRADRDAGPATLVALQSANHEVGTLQPVDDVAEALADSGSDVPLFVDACASAGRVPLPRRWSVAAASSHKLGGPAGVGLLLVRKGARWRSPFPGDDRGDDRATGFENVPAALGAAAALQACVAEAEERNARQARLVDRLRTGVAHIPDVEVVGDPVDRLPHLVTFSFLYVDGEALVHALDRHGLGVASGSACTAASFRPSHVLEAMGVLTHGNVRVGLTREATDDDVERLLGVLPGVVADLRREVGL